MTKKSDRKRRAIKKKELEEKKSSKLKKPNFAKNFLSWKKDNPSNLIKKLKDLGYIKKDESEE